MLPFLLLLAGGAVSLYCLWQFKRWLGEPQEANPAGSQRLEVLVDELVATAEATSAVVQEKAETLTELIAEADRRIRALADGGAEAPAPAAAVQRPAVAAPVPETAVHVPAGVVQAQAAAAQALPTVAPEPARTAAAPPAPASALPELHRQVYALADSGHDVTAIARRLGLSKGEVMLVLGLRK